MPDWRWYTSLRTIVRRLRARLLPVYVEHHTRFVTPDPTDVCANPIFVLGAHRSGTTLMRRILDSHPRIACPPESQFMVHFFNLVQHERSMIGLADLGFHEAEALRLLRQSASQFHEIYRRAKGKPRWADKTPEYVDHLPGLYRLFGDVATFVMMFRHPLDVATSRWTRLMHLVKRPDKQQLVDICQKVAVAQAHQLEFLQQHAAQTWVIFYEELVANPEQILRGMCTFLGEPWDECLLRHDELPHDYGLEDPIVRVTRGFKPSHGNWRQWSARQLRVALDILQPVMDQLGYSTDSVQPKAEFPFLSRAA
uniref:Sulfotransferase n=1 Tax=Schlesneria paludicola TaxID=360056 RepID=A0A7C4LQS8_9PLAN